MKTKLLTTIIICSLHSLSLIGMDDFKADFNAFKSGTNRKVTEKNLRKRAEKLAKNNKKNYYQIAQMTHPDKNDGQEAFRTIFEAAENAYKNPEKTRKNKSLQEKTLEYEAGIIFLNSYKDQIIVYGYHSLINTKRSLIESAIQSLIYTLSSKITPDCLKNNEAENITADYTAYKLDLEKETKDNYNEARSRLNQYLKKDN